MTETIQVGAQVPEFQVETYDAGRGEFGSFSLAEQKRKGRWTILVFYPADFTFV